MIDENTTPEECEREFRRSKNSRRTERRQQRIAEIESRPPDPPDPTEEIHAIVDGILEVLAAITDDQPRRYAAVMALQDRLNKLRYGS